MSLMRAAVLDRNVGLVGLMYDLRRVLRPIGVAQCLAGNQYQIRTSITHNLIGLHRLRNQAHCCRRYICPVPDCLGERHLIAGTNRNRSAGQVAARATINQIDPFAGQDTCEISREDLAQILAAAKAADR